LARLRGPTRSCSGCARQRLRNVWQFPVVVAPLGTRGGGQRGAAPIDSIDGMTARRC
jgi:hypothetical protein